MLWPFGPMRGLIGGGRCHDQGRSSYLECAVEGNATHLVSGDRDLLRLVRFEGIAIVTPQAFLDVLAVQ